MYRRPDLRGLVRPKLSAEPLGGAAPVDYDDLSILRSWREYEPDRPGEVRYFCYELSQRDVGSTAFVPFYKAVRFVRVTRVPRYLRQMSSSAGGTIFSHQRKLLAGLREQQVLFVNLVAKSPKIPLIFAYGVQAASTSLEQAKLEADRSHAVLEHLLDGVYQQLEYTPLSVHEGEHLVRYQAEWNHIAMARGRPRPLGADGAADSYLDGNRTDVENSLNMMESFVRGMGDRSFLLSMVCAPISPYEMTLAWSNLTRTLSDVRSDQVGQRSVNAAVAIPLSMSAGQGQSVGTSHTSGATIGQNASHTVAHTDSASASVGVTDTHSQSATDSHGTSASIGHTETVSHGVGVSHGTADSVGASESASHTDTASASHGANTNESHGVNEARSEGVNVAESQGVSQSEGVSLGQTNTVGQAATATESQSLSVGQTHGVSSAASLGHSDTSSLSWGSSLTAGSSAGVSAGTTAGLNNSQSLSQAVGLTNTSGDGASDSHGQSSGGNFGANLFGLGGSNNAGETASFGRNLTNSNALANTLSTGGSTGASLSQAWNNNFGQSVAQSDQMGSSHGVGVTASNTVGENLSQMSSQSAGFARGLTDSQSMSVAQSVNQGHGWTAGTSVGQSTGSSVGQTSAASMGYSAGSGQSTAVGEGVGVSSGHSVNASASESFGTASATSRTDGVNAAHADTTGVSRGVSRAESISAGDTQGAGVGSSQAASDAYVAAFSNTVQHTAGMGVVPSLGLSLSKTTMDEAKRTLGDVLEAQMNRYMEGLEAGAYLYQMSLICPDRNALVGAAGLLKAAFWGAGDGTRVVQPFHVADGFEPDEQQRLLMHAAAFSAYRKREPSMAIVEPFVWSTYITAGEAAGVTHPPVAEAPGLLVVHDSMPVFAMPADREDRDIYLGWVMNGERAKVSSIRFGLDLNELNHTLVAGVTGSGKTTLLSRFIYEAVRSSSEVVVIDAENPARSETREVPAGALIVDWARSFRSLAPVVGAHRFRFMSVARPELGRFRFNPLAVPHPDTDAAEWAGMVADQFMVAFGLGEFARSIFYDCLHRLYSANRLVDVELAAAVTDPDTGEVLRPAVRLEAVPRSDLPDVAVRVDPHTDTEVASVYTYPELSRLVGLTHVAAMVASMQEALALDPKNRQMSGGSMADRLQTVWRRILPYAPGGNLEPMVAPDERLGRLDALRVPDLVDPDLGLVTVLEADGLDILNRRFMLGALLQAVWRWGEAAGDGSLNQGGAGPGTFVLLEEAHELLGSQSDGEDRESAAKRAAIYESMFRRSRKLGMKLIAAVQNPSGIPDAVLGNVGTVICHRVKAERDKATMAGLFNWMSTLGQQTREIRYLGEMPTGHCIVQRSAREHYLESAPVYIAVDPPALPAVSDAQLTQLAAWRASLAESDNKVR